MVRRWNSYKIKSRIKTLGLIIILFGLQFGNTRVFAESATRDVEGWADIFCIDSIVVNDDNIELQIAEHKNSLCANTSLDRRDVFGVLTSIEKERNEEFKKTGRATLRIRECSVIPQDELGFEMQLKSIKNGVAFIEFREDFSSPVDPKGDIHRKDVIKIDKIYKKSPSNN